MSELSRHFVQGGSDCGKVISVGLAAPLQSEVEVASVLVDAVCCAVQRSRHRSKLEGGPGHPPEYRERMFDEARTLGLVAPNSRQVAEVVLKRRITLTRRLTHQKVELAMCSGFGR